ncbi:hypothetical protein EJB05_40103, partial [Eragrostis curvula]
KTAGTRTSRLSNPNRPIWPAQSRLPLRRLGLFLVFRLLFNQALVPAPVLVESFACPPKYPQKHSSPRPRLEAKKLQPAESPDNSPATFAGAPGSDPRTCCSQNHSRVDLRGDAMEEQEQRPLLEVEQCVTSIPEDHEANCWGCGLRLVFASYAPVFKCGWCGAITQSNQAARKSDSVCFSHWRRFRDRFFVTVLILFMIFIICGGVWAVYPVVFSISNFWGIFHCTLTAFLAIFTITSYCLASFKSAGAPAHIRWGSYPMVGKDDLENYTFCTYCSKPKPPRAHHCRSCKMCVMDMDHHCPFIGNCVGAANHRAFVIFLISVVVSCTYVAIMTIYSSYRIWPSVDFPNLASSRHSRSSMKILMEILTTLASSALFLSARGIILVYLAFASLSVNAGIVVLLCQQLKFIYEGNTYLGRLNSVNVLHGEKGLQNLVRFFGCPYPISRILLRCSNTGKLQENSGAKLL